MFSDRLQWRKLFWLLSFLIFFSLSFISIFWEPIWYLLIIFLPVFLLGVYDIFQKKSNVLRNYPLTGHFRYLLEGIRPQMHQYFIESNTDGKPFSREERDLVYERAAKTIDTLPFGTQREVNELGFDFANHSMAPKSVAASEGRVFIGNLQCTKPYHASRLNVSAMSFGAISKNAVLALNRGARIGGFAHNTGEGGLTPYHLQEGGDIIWQIGTAYFGCRTKEGHFSPDKFQEKARQDVVKMIEIKISQGAKPSHGGILPAAKITPEIAEIRGVPMGADCFSPPQHETFSTPRGLLEFVQQLRELSDGKPVGFKLCMGKRSEFLSICKAMVKTGIYPDFITIDGAEGGTGAAPLEFADHIGTPLNEGLVFVHNALMGVGVREHVRLIASGKIISGFDMICKMALGADLCNSARGMMFALGCIQSRRCNTNKCPTGVTTQDPNRYYGLAVDEKAPMVANFHDATIKSFLEVLGAVGVATVKELRPERIRRRISPGNVLTYLDIYPYLKHRQLLDGPIPDEYTRFWAEANAERF